MTTSKRLKPRVHDESDVPVWTLAPDPGRDAVRRLDPNSPEFAAEAKRQSRLVAESPQAKEDQDLVDAISEFNSK